MADYQAGTAFLTVLPDMSGFGAKVREELAKDQTELKIPVKPDVDTTKGAKDGEEYGGAFGDAMKARIEAALKSLPKAQIDADSTEADRKIDELRTRLEELRDKRIGIDLSAEEALAEIAGIKTDLDELGRKSPNVQVKVDALKAAADLAGIRAEVTALDGKNVDIRVSDGGSARQATSDVNGLLLAGLSLGPALIPIGSAVAAAFASIGTGAVIGAGAIATVVLGFHGVTDALKDMDTAQQSSGKTAAQTAAQQISSANSVASAQDGVRNAVRAVADAQHEAAISAQQSAQQVASAQQSLQDAYIQSGIAMRGALQSEEQARQSLQSAIYSQTVAEQTLANAQQQEQLAQESLTLARQAAQRQIESLTLAVEDGALAERQAALNIQQTKQQLDQTLANPQASQLQRDQAQLSYDQAVQQLKDVQARNKNLQEDQAAAAKAGVDGSQQVQAAQRGVQQATQGVAAAQHGVQQAAQDVANAQQNLANAQANVAETQRTNTERIAQAQQALASAEQNQAETARKNAESIQKAQEGVVSAQRALAGALAQQAAQQDTVSASANKLAKDMADLSPAGRQFVTFLHDEMEPKVKDLQATAQEGLLPGVEDGLRALFPVFPEITSFVNVFATSLGDLARRAGQALTDPFWRNFFGFIKDEAGPSIQTFGTIIGNIFTGIAGMLQGFKPIWDAMGVSIENFTDKFAAWGKAVASGDSEGFNKFLQYVQESAPVVIDFLKQFGTLIGHIVDAFAGQGISTLQVLTETLRIINGLPLPVIQALIDLYIAIKAATLVSNGLKSISDTFITIGKLPGQIKDFAGTIRDLPGDIAKIGASLKTNISDALDKIKSGGGLKGALGLTGIAVGAYVAGSALEAAGSPLPEGQSFGTASTGAKVSDAADTAGKLLTLDIPGLFDKISQNIKQLPDDLHTAGDRISGFAQGIKDAFGGIGDGVGQLRTDLGVAWSNIADNASTRWNGIKNAVSNAAGDFRNTVSDHVTSLGKTLHDDWDSFWQNASDRWSNIRDTVSDRARELRDNASNHAAELRDWLGGHWQTIWQSATDRWNTIRTDVSNIAGSIRDGVSSAIGALRDNVTGAFQTAVDNIQNIWNRLGDIAKVPVNFVINTVYNAGIVPMWNGIAGLFGLAKLNPAVPLATGGVLPGYSPGRDSVPAILSPGEGVLVPEAVRGLGPDFVHSANAYFSGGRSTGGRSSAGGVSYFADGGIVGSVIGGIADFVADPIGAVKKAFNSVLGATIPGIGLLHDALAAIPAKVVDGAVSLVKGAVAKIGSFFSAAFTGSPDLQGWIMQAIQLTGVPASWAGPLSVLIMRESGGNPNAINNWDSNAAAGHPSQGLMQTIPSTFSAYHQPGTSWNILDPIANIAAGINYIRAVYGDISNVQQANPNLPPKGYDSGGWLPPGITVAYNGTGQHERILTGPQYQQLTAAASRSELQPVTVNVYPRAEHSEADIADMVSRRLEFAMRANT
jgi:hypothetical protein